MIWVIVHYVQDHYLQIGNEIFLSDLNYLNLCNVKGVEVKVLHTNLSSGSLAIRRLSLKLPRWVQLPLRAPTNKWRDARGMG